MNHFHFERERSIYLIEEFYCAQMESLVDDERFDDAHSIFEEFVVDSEEPIDWTFMPFLEDVC
jgi:hypothetical protein